MDQPSDNSNKEGSTSGQFDYSGLTAPESMGGSNAVPPPEPAPTPSAPTPPSTPTPPPPSPTPEPAPAPVAEPPKTEPLAFPNQSQTDNLDLDAPKQTGNMQTPMSAHSSLGTWFLIIILTILLGLAILVFLSWKGYVSIGFLDKFWGVSPTPTPVASETSTPTAQSNDSVRKQNLASIAQSLQKYYADNTAYPISAVMIKTSDTQSVLAQSLVPSYITTLADDPLAPSFYYGYKSDGKTFELSAVLEDKTDVAGTLSGNLNIYKVTNTTN